MYGKKNLKKTAIPTKNLPSTPTRSIGVQTKAPKIIILQSSRSMLTEPGTSSGPERFESEKPLTDDHASQTLAKLTDHTPRKRKLCTLLHHSASQVRKHNKAYEDSRPNSTIEQFLIGCDKFLKPNFSTIVKAQLCEDSMLAADSPFSTHSPLPRTSTSSDETMNKNVSSDEERKIIIDEVLKAINDEDEFDGIGMIVASKLRRMDEDQRIYAEVLTNSILIHGIKKGLQNETSLTGLKYT